MGKVEGGIGEIEKKPAKRHSLWKKQHWTMAKTEEMKRSVGEKILGDKGDSDRQELRNNLARKTRVSRMKWVWSFWKIMDGNTIQCWRER